MECQLTYVNCSAFFFREYMGKSYEVSKLGGGGGGGGGVEKNP